MSTSSPDYAPLIPYLTVKDAAQAIEFYKTAFGATERFRLTDKSGMVGHAELMIAGCMIMLSEENPAWNKSPQTLGGTAVKFSLMVENADAGIAKAEAAGATVTMPPMDMFYGHRSGAVRDPFGHEWMIQHEIEKVAPEEMQKRWDAMDAECSGGEQSKP